MSLIRWGDDLSLDIIEIDKQHKQLTEIMNKFFDAIKEGKGNDVIDDILESLVDYTEYHFKTEEKYFDQFQYAESEQHKEEHKYFRAQVIDIKKACDAGKSKRDDSDLIITVDLWKLLKDLFINHLQTSDKKYAPLFKEKGLK